MFKGWDTFYMLIGSVAGALISLLFVVATLTDRADSRQVMRGTRLYMTPTVFHFAVVLVVAALALIPRLPPSATELGLGVAALWGLGYMLVVGRQFMPDKHPDAPHWSDAWCYAVVPAVFYLVLTVGVAGLRPRPDLAVNLVGLDLLALLLIAIRNAWDLVTWLAPNPTGEGPQANRPPADAG